MTRRESASELRARLQRTAARPQHIEIVTDADTELIGVDSKPAEESKDSRSQESVKSRSIEPGERKVSVGTQMYAARKRQLAMEHAVTGKPEWKIIDDALDMYFKAKGSESEAT